MALEYVEISGPYSVRRTPSMGREKLAARKSKRGHKKRHAVNEEKSENDRRRHQTSIREQKERDAALDVYRAMVRMYWMGAQDTHP